MSGAALADALSSLVAPCTPSREERSIAVPHACWTVELSFVAHIAANHIPAAHPNYQKHLVEAGLTLFCNHSLCKTTVAAHLELDVASVSDYQMRTEFSLEETQAVRDSAPGRRPLQESRTLARSSWDMHTADLGDAWQQVTVQTNRKSQTMVLGPSNALWYSSLCHEERTRVAQEVAFATVNPRTAILPRGTSDLSWIGVLEGFVAVTKSYRDGRQATLAGIPPGGWFGEDALLRREPYAYEAHALRRSVIARMPIETFDWLLERSFAFNRYVMRQLNERLSQVLDDREIDRHLDTDARVSRSLGLLFQPTLYPSDGYHIRITQQELATFCRMSRQRVNEALTRLEQNGWIRVEYGGIRILDLARLQQRPVPALRDH